MELKGAKVTIASSSVLSRSSFYENLYSLGGLVNVDNSSHVFQNKDVLIIPCDNSFGLLNKITQDLVEMLGEKLELEVKAYINDMYFGEVPRGESFLIPWRSISGVPRSPRYICWTCMSRVPSDLRPDFSYSTVWSAFSCINTFNKQLKEDKEKDKKESKKKTKLSLENIPPLKSIVIPELSEFIDGEGEELELKVRESARQMSFAIKTWVTGEFIEVEETKTGERRHQQIVRELSASNEELQRELEALLWSRELEVRGICNPKELAMLIEWVNSAGSKSMSSAQALCALLRREPTEFVMTQQAISEAITGKNGCLHTLVNLGVEGKVKVHDEIHKNEVEFLNEIGTGNAGKVFKAKWKGKIVAVKMFEGGDVDSKEFIKEVVMLSLIHNQYIVTCWGACVTKDTRFIVEELMDGSLYDYLHDPKQHLDDQIRLELALQCAFGLHFLHSIGLIHRDLKSLNLLITRTLELKLCDFGLSRVIDKTKMMTSCIGTVAWIAPEVLGKRPYTEKADVYSFGIILWELVTREIPFGHVESFSVPVLVSKAERPPLPKNCSKEWKSIITKCWNQKASKRPAFDEIIRRLKRMQTGLRAEATRVLHQEDKLSDSLSSKDKTNRLRSIKITSSSSQSGMSESDAPQSNRSSKKPVSRGRSSSTSFGLQGSEVSESSF